MTRPTDDDGKIQLTFTKNDPKPDDDGNIVTVIVTVTDPYTSNTPPTIVRTIQWSDAEAEATTIKLSSTRPYVKLPADEGEKARVTIYSEVLDQYGDPYPQSVFLIATSTNTGDNNEFGTGLPWTGERRTGFRVEYTVGGDDEAGAAQRFAAFTITDDVGDDDPTNDLIGIRSEGIDETPTTRPNALVAGEGFTVYWAVKEDDLDTGTTIVHIDEDENTIVVSSATQTAYAVYDSNDQFLIGTTPVLLDKFQEELDQGRTITWTIRDEVSTFTLAN